MNIIFTLPLRLSASQAVGLAIRSHYQYGHTMAQEPLWGWVMKFFAHQKYIYLEYMPYA